MIYKKLIIIFGNDINSIIQKYLLSTKIENQKIFNNTITLLNNIRDLKYIDTLDNNIIPTCLKRPYIVINKNNITINYDKFQIYLDTLNKN